jgi:hypothetical protein
MKNLEKKIRIQLYTPDFDQISDRLVVQSTEFSKGPEKAHKGPFRIELNLFEESDITEAITYLKQLTGLVPTVSPKKRVPKSKLNPQTESYSQDLLEELSEIRDPAKFNDLLTNQGFIFTTAQFLKDMGLPINLPKKFTDSNNYRILIRVIKKAKSLLNNKYDPTLIVVIPRKPEGDDLTKEGHVVVKLFSLADQVGEVILPQVKTSKLKVPKGMLTKFPMYMTQEERNKFRLERDKLVKNPELAPSKFYKRWVHAVADESKGRGVTFPHMDSIEKPY